MPHESLSVRRIAIFVLLLVLGCSYPAVAAGTPPNVRNVFPAPEFYEAFPNPGSPGNGQLGIIDPSTFEIRSLIPFPNLDYLAPAFVASPTKPLIYASTNSGTYIAVFDINSLTVERVIAMPSYITDLAIAPSGDRLYAWARYFPQRYIIEISGDTVTGTLQLPANLSGVTTADHGAKIFASMSSLNEVAVIKRETNTIERIVFAGSCRSSFGQNPCRPGSLTTSNDGKYVVATAWQNAIVFDGVSGSVLQKIPLGGKSPYLLGVDRFSNTLWIHVVGGVCSLPMQPPFNSTFIPFSGYNYGNLAFDSANHALSNRDENGHWSLWTYTPPYDVDKVGKLGNLFGGPILYMQ